MPDAATAAAAAAAAAVLHNLPKLLPPFASAADHRLPSWL